MTPGLLGALAAALEEWHSTYVLDQSLEGYENSTQFSHMAEFALGRPRVVAALHLSEDGGHSTMLGGF